MAFSESAFTDVAVPIRLLNGHRFGLLNYLISLSEIH